MGKAFSTIGAFQGKLGTLCHVEVGAHVKPCEVVEVNQLNNVHTKYKKKRWPCGGGQAVLYFTI